MQIKSTRLSLRPTWGLVKESASSPVNRDEASLPVRTIIAEQLLALLRADGCETHTDNLVMRAGKVLHQRRIRSYLIAFIAMQCVIAAVMLICLGSYGPLRLAGIICGILAAGLLIFMALNHRLCAKHAVKLWESDPHHPADTDAETSEAFLRFAYAPLLIEALKERRIPADGMESVRTLNDLRDAVKQLHAACAKDAEANSENVHVKAIKTGMLLRWIDISITLGIFSIPADGETVPEIVQKLYVDARHGGSEAFLQQEARRKEKQSPRSTQLIAR